MANTTRATSKNADPCSVTPNKRRRSFLGPQRKKKLPPGFSAKRVPNQSPYLHRLARKPISPVASVHMILSKRRTTKALIRLRACTGWSAPVLFANPQRQVFSRQGPLYMHLFWSVVYSCINKNILQAMTSAQKRYTAQKA